MGSTVRMVVGNTSTGIYKNENAQILIDLTQIPDLFQTSLTSNGATFWAGITLTDMLNLLTQYANSTQFPVRTDHCSDRLSGVPNATI